MAEPKNDRACWTNERDELAGALDEVTMAIQAKDFPVRGSGSAGARLLLWTLWRGCDGTGATWLSLQRLSERTGLSTRTLKRRIAGLVESRLVEIDSPPKTGRPSNVYRVIGEQVRELARVEQERRSAAQQRRTRGHGGPGGAHGGPGGGHGGPGTGATVAQGGGHGGLRVVPVVTGTESPECDLLGESPADKRAGDATASTEQREAVSTTTNGTPGGENVGRTPTGTLRTPPGEPAGSDALDGGGTGLPPSLLPSRAEDPPAASPLAPRDDAAGWPDAPSVDDAEDASGDPEASAGPIPFPVRGGRMCDGAKLLVDLEGRFPGRDWRAWLEHEAERCTAEGIELPSAGALNVLLRMAADAVASGAIPVCPQAGVLPFRPTGAADDATPHAAVAGGR